MKKTLFAFTVVMVVLSTVFFNAHAMEPAIGKMSINTVRVRMPNQHIIGLIQSVVSSPNEEAGKAIYVEYKNGYWIATILLTNGAEITDADMEKIKNCLPDPWREGKDGEKLLEYHEMLVRREWRP